MLRTLLLNRIVTAFWRQRNYLPLHGSAIATPQGVMIFAGISGSGTSTLATVLAQRGYPLLADEISVITFCRQGRPQLRPTGGQRKFWRAAAHKLGQSGDIGRALRVELAKSYQSVTQREAELLTVHCLYILQAAQVEQVTLQPLEGIAKLAPIQSNLYQPQLPADLQQRNALLQQLAQLANQVKVQLLTRPRQHFAVDQLVALLEADWQRG